MKVFSTLVASVVIAIFGVTATPVPEAEANPLMSLEKRADNWCRVATAGTDCRSQPGVGAGTNKKDINVNELFGVRCTKVVDGRTWDWVPGWGCWVTARETRSADTSNPSCESGLPRC